MKLWKIAALCLLSAPALAQVQLGRNVQIGGSSGGSGCSTAGITPGDLLFPDLSGTCLGSDNIQASGVVGGANGADTLTIKTPTTSPGDDINVILSSAVNPGQNYTFLSPHLWQMKCGNSGTTEQGCTILMDVNDGEVATPGQGGLEPIYIKMRATQGGDHPSYSGVEIEQHANDGLDQSTNNYVGFNIDGFSQGVDTTWNAVRGYAYQPNFAHIIAATDFSGFGVFSHGGQTLPSNYCDFRGQDTSGSPIKRESIGCGPSFISTFYGPLLLPTAAPVSGTDCLQIDSTGAISNTGAACGSGGSGAVNSVSNSDSTLTFSPTTGAVVGSLNLTHANTWTATQTLSGLTFSGITGLTQCLHVNSAGVVSGTGVDCGAGGGGSTVTINGGSALSTANFNNTTPGPGAGFINASFQNSGATVSAEVPYATGSAFGVIKPDGSTCSVTGGVLACPGAGSGLSGQTPGYLPLATSATASSTSSSLQDTGSSLVYHGSGTIHALTLPEGTAATAVAGADIVYADSTSHCLKYSANGGSFTCLGSSGGSTTVASAEVVTFSATPTFSVAFNVSRMTLTGNVTSFTLGAGSDGQSKTLCFAQGAGPYSVLAPANVHGFFTIGTTNGGWNCQTFAYDASDSLWLATSLGVQNE